MKIKKGDNIIVISGRDKGKKGKVGQVLPQKQRIVVEGLNMRKKTIRPRQQGQKGQIVEVALSFDASNAKIVCPKCDKPTRVGYKMEDNKKYRFCKKCGSEI